MGTAAERRHSDGGAFQRLETVGGRRRGGDSLGLRDILAHGEGVRLLVHQLAEHHPFLLAGGAGKDVVDRHQGRGEAAAGKTGRDFGAAAAVEDLDLEAALLEHACANSDIQRRVDQAFRGDGDAHVSGLRARLRRRNRRHGGGEKSGEQQFGRLFLAHGSDPPELILLIGSLRLLRFFRGGGGVAPG